MNETTFPFVCSNPPPALATLRQRTAALGFPAASDDRTGQLLKALASSKPGGRFLELGTGTGIGTAWMLSGMDADARLQSIDSDGDIQQTAVDVLGGDPRVTFHTMEGKDYITQAVATSYDLIFADAWSGKFFDLDATLQLLKVGGIYVIDDLLPQENWPENHQPRSDALVATLEANANLSTLRLDWSTGLMLAIRRN
ncbi:MAG: class I SAM-dependent methyltransferase [Pseudomonadota bacterium]